MTTITQSDYAKRKGWNRSTVTRLKQAGRLVMVDGLVDVEATEARLADTAGGRDDVAARHAAGRGEVEKVSRGGTPPAGRGQESVEGGRETKASAAARKEVALANEAEDRVRLLRNELITWEDATFAAKSAFAEMMADVEAMPDQIAPVLEGQDLEDRRATLAEWCRSHRERARESIRKIRREDA